MTEAGGFPRYDTDRLQTAVDDFLDHLQDDLPEGPPSTEELFDPPHLVTLSESEYRRLAELGKRMVDEYAASKAAKD